jgi:hypothetical protein
VRRSPQPRPPAAVTSNLDLRPHERILAWACGSSGEWYVGTNLALHLPDPAGGYRRLGWEDVERAHWQRDSDRLAIVEVADWNEPERTTVVSVTEPGRLLELLRERVTKSVVCTMYARVRGRAGLSVVGRRSPAGTGPITWSYVLSAGLDPADPDVVRVAGTTLAEAQAELAGL